MKTIYIYTRKTKWIVLSQAYLSKDQISAEYKPVFILEKKDLDQAFTDALFHCFDKSGRKIDFPSFTSEGNNDLFIQLDNNAFSFEVNSSPHEGRLGGVIFF